VIGWIGWIEERSGRALKIGKGKESEVSVSVLATPSREQPGIPDSLFVPVENERLVSYASGAAVAPPSATQWPTGSSPSALAAGQALINSGTSRSQALPAPGEWASLKMAGFWDTRESMEGSP